MQIIKMLSMIQLQPNASVMNSFVTLLIRCSLKVLRRRLLLCPPKPMLSKWLGVVVVVSHSHFARSLSRSLTRSLTHSLTHSLAHSQTHSPFPH